MDVKDPIQAAAEFLRKKGGDVDIQDDALWYVPTAYEKVGDCYLDSSELIELAKSKGWSPEQIKTEGKG